MNLIKLDRKAVQAFQKRFGLSNYGMVNLRWAFGFAVGVITTLILHWVFLPH